MKLSIIIPVYNERETINEILARISGLKLMSGLDKEIIVIDDGSTDGTSELLEKTESIILINHPVNSGKGSAVRDGLLASTGDFVVIQDADLEYDPKDINSLISPLLDGSADVVYGSRFLGKTNRPKMYKTHYWGNRLLTLISNIFTGLNLSDMETGYKAFSRKVVDEIKNKLISNRFDIEPEITEYVKKFKLQEVPIFYEGRTFEQSKKIGWRDGLGALQSIVFSGKNIFNWNNICLALLFLFLILISMWRLPYSPATWFDEGINIGIAKSLINNGIYNLEVGPGQYVENPQFLITTNYPVLLPVALSLKLFGMNLTAARVPMVIFLFLFALAAYVLVKRIYDEKSAFWSLALIVSFVPFYGNGKDVLGEVPGLFFLLAGLLTLPEGRNWKRLAASGFLFGLSIATKPFFLLILPALFIGELRGVRWSLASSDFWRRFGVLSAGASVPVLGWLYTILPDASLAGVFTAINYYSNSYASTNIPDLVISNIVRFMTEITPLHFLFMALLVGAAVILRGKRGGKLTEVELVIFIFILLNFLWYLKTPGWYRYFFPAHLMLFLFFPQAIKMIFNSKIAIAVLGGLFIIQTGYLLTKHNDPLYNSDEAIIFSDFISESTDKNSKILVANGPSVAFLMNDRRVTQYLQINPTLFFGSEKLFSNNEFIYDYIVVNRPIENILIDNFASNLSRNYRVIYEKGHFILYKKYLNE